MYGNEYDSKSSNISTFQFLKRVSGTIAGERKNHSSGTDFVRRRFGNLEPKNTLCTKRHDDHH